MEIDTKLVRQDKLKATMGSFIDLEYVIHIIEKGSLTYQNEEEVFQIGTGDIFVIPPKMLHAITNQQDLDMTVIHFTDRSSTLESMNIKQVIHLPQKKFSDIKKLSKLLRELWFSARQESGIACDGITQTIVGLYCVYSKGIFKSEGEALKFKNWESIKIAVQFIQKNFTDPDFSVKAVCLHANISYNYFSTLFAKYTNETPLNYINRVRIDYAKTLMFNSTHNITEAAYASGFANLQHFSKIFKQREGMAPSNWLKKSTMQ